MVLHLWGGSPRQWGGYFTFPLGTTQGKVLEPSVKGGECGVNEGRLIYPCLLSPQYMGCVEVLQSMRALDFNTRTQVTRLVERPGYCWSPRVGEVTEVSVRRRREVEHLVVVLVATYHWMAKRIETKLQKCV